MNILVIGAGMYVTGRFGSGPGSVLATIGEVSKSMRIDGVTVVSKNESSREDVFIAVNEINTILEIGLRVDYEALGENSIENLKTILERKKYDCGVIALPDHLHYDFAKVLIENSIHCLVVKPLTPTVKESMELIALRKKKNVYGVVDLHKRYDQANLFIKDAIQSGQIGKPQYVTVEYSQRIMIPTIAFAKWVKLTNIFQYLGVHYVDMIYFMTGYYPEKVLAVGTKGKLTELGMDTYDSIHAIIIWKNPGNENEKLVAQFSTNWIDPNTSSALSDQKYNVIGTKGRIECDQKHRGIELVNEDGGIQTINPYFSKYHSNPKGKKSYTGYDFASISQFIYDVQDLESGNITIEELENIRPTFEDSIGSTAVVDAVNRSLNNNSNWEFIDDLS